MNRETLSKQISCLLNIAYVPKLEDYLIHPQINIITKHKLWALNAINASIREPKLSQWDYLGKNDVEVFLKLSEYKAIQKFIGCTLKQNVKGNAKTVFVELMVSVHKFCNDHNFDVEKSGATLSQFYLSHLYFTSSFNMPPETVYIFFKEHTMCHTLPFPPNSNIFSLKDAKDLMEFFYQSYIRNLPLIRYLCLPNFTLCFNFCTLKASTTEEKS